MLSLILKILRDKVGELYNSINRKMQPLPLGMIRTISLIPTP